MSNKKKNAIAKSQVPYEMASESLEPVSTSEPKAIANTESETMADKYNQLAKTEASVAPISSAQPPELPKAEVLETAQATHELGDEAYQQGRAMVRDVANEQRNRQAEGIRDGVMEEQRVNRQFRQECLSSIIDALRFQ